MPFEFDNTEHFWRRDKIRKMLESPATKCSNCQKLLYNHWWLIWVGKDIYECSGQHDRYYLVIPELRTIRTNELFQLLENHEQSGSLINSVWELTTFEWGDLRSVYVRIAPRLLLGNGNDDSDYYWQEWRPYLI